MKAEKAANIKLEYDMKAAKKKKNELQGKIGGLQE